MSIPAAAGYVQYSQSLIDPIFSTRWLARSYAETNLTKFTTTEYNGSLSSYGDEIWFKRPAQINVHRYTHKNMKLKTDTVEVETLKMTVDEGYYWQTKIDDVDVKQMGPNYAKFKDSILESGPRAIAYAIEKTVLARMVKDVPAANRGKSAGKSGLDLGTVGDPLAVTSSNWTEFMLRCSTVLQENYTWVDGNMFMIIPPVAQIAMLSSPLGMFYGSGIQMAPVLNQSGPQFAGKINPAGFDLIVSSLVPRVYDQIANAQCHYILFGRKSATAYVQQLSKMESGIRSEHYFGEKMRALQIFGSKPLLSEQLGVAYVRFQ